MAQKAQSRDSQIQEAMTKGIQQIKSHAEVMKRVGAANDAMAKHQALQQQHAAPKKVAGGNPAARPVGKAPAFMRKRVTK